MVNLEIFNQIWFALVICYIILRRKTQQTITIKQYNLYTFNIVNL
jgi:hypothetical protein